MLIEVSEVEYCKLNVQFEADPQQVEERRTEIIQSFKSADVPGFRPGKAPIDAIKHHYKNNIQESLKNEMAHTAFTTTIAEKNIRPFGYPEFLSLQLEGSKFKCNFCVNSVPTVELKKYKGFDIPKGQIPNAVEMAEKILQELRKNNGETLPFTEDDFIQTGDTAIINFIGMLDGEEHPVIKQDGELLVIGKADLESFNDNLLGMKIGEKREFGQVMPDTSSPRVAGKLVKYVVELINASHTNPCALDDELAQKVGAKDINDLIAMTQGMASKRCKDLQKRYLTEQIAVRLIEEHSIKIPEWLSLVEAKLLARQLGDNWDNVSDKDKVKLLEVSTKNISLSIILDKIRQEEPDAQLTDEEVIKIINNNMSHYKSLIPNLANVSDEEAFNKIVKSGFITSFTSQIKDDYTVDFIIKNSNIVE
jgi:trigger factor